MPASLPPRKIKKNRSAKISTSTSAPFQECNAAAEEIHSFIAVRDLLLAEAEELTNEANLHRLWMANEFAARCLEPARAPYQMQCLSPVEATVERRRCQAVNVRIAQLRQRICRHAA